MNKVKVVKVKEYNFKADISKINSPTTLNNPFGSIIPKIAALATDEFQEFISAEHPGWSQNLIEHKGKMFGVLVVEREDKSMVYLGGVSGNLPLEVNKNDFVPSIFDVSTSDYFINKGMTQITEIGAEIKVAKTQAKVIQLTEDRTQKSKALQQRLFENYLFLNMHSSEKNLIDIFKNSSHGNPPSAAGECAAPKLLQYAFKHGLKPIALTESWWGKSPKGMARKHKEFYPACKNKCRPILEFMLDDFELFNNVKTQRITFS